jgi:diguanylate cyclase (GGDEF)-like protein
MTDAPRSPNPDRDRQEMASTPPPFERLRPHIGAATRAIVLTLGVAGVTGLATISGAAVGYDIRRAVVFALPAGVVVGWMFALLIILFPEWRAQRDRRKMIARIEAVAHAEREAAFDTLLDVHPNHELAELAHTIHRAILSAHIQRLEAARMRREVAVLVEKETRRKYAHLATLSFTDELTGLANRRGFDRGLARMVERAKAQEEEIALLAIDLDHFKRLNDTCGHDKGDEALAIAGDLIQAHTREGDLAGRIGGDELLIALHGVDVESAQRIADRLIQLYASHPAGGTSIPWPTMSIGIAMLQVDQAQNAAELRRFADQALYASKRAGRRRFTRFSQAA